MEDYLDEALFYPYKDRLLEKFRTSDFLSKYVETRRKKIVADADLMLQIGYNYYEADHVSKWTAYSLEDYALSHLPRKMMAGPSSFAQMGKNLVVFAKWLKAEDLVPIDEDLVGMMQEAAKGMAEASKRY